MKLRKICNEKMTKFQINLLLQITAASFHSFLFPTLWISFLSNTSLVAKEFYIHMLFFMRPGEQHKISLLPVMLTRTRLTITRINTKRKLPNTDDWMLRLVKTPLKKKSYESNKNSRLHKMCSLTSPNKVMPAIKSQYWSTNRNKNFMEWKR